MHPCLVLPVLLAVAQPSLSASEIAGYLRLISTQAQSPGRVACRDLDMALQLKKAGISTDPRSTVAWAANAEQARAFQGEGKLVICSDRSLVGSGAALVLEQEGGKIRLLIHLGHAKASGVALSDTLLKAARPLS